MVHYFLAIFCYRIVNPYLYKTQYTVIVSKTVLHTIKT